MSKPTLHLGLIMTAAGVILWGAACSLMPNMSKTPTPPVKQPISTEDLFLQGVDQYRAGQFGHAKETFDRVISSQSRHLQAYNYRGRSLIELKQLSPASGDFDTCLQIDSRFAPAYSGKAMIFIQ
ncbi:MAG: hypothetical protein KJ768_04455, partial [Acidobacteria bacterium]|nr:hypothetical protein [Acidobacteriota bacterium]